LSDEREHLGRVIGLDLGDRRVGVALSDPMRIIASPLLTIQRRNDEWKKELYALIEAHEVREIVLGLPRHMDGREGAGAEEARKLATELETRGLKVILWDERLTTVSAQKALREMGVKAKQQKGAIDQVAAQLILSGYLNSRPSPL
jgi:putative Holliday junction resolvase